MRNIKYKLYSPSWNKVFRVVNIVFDKQGLIETVAVPMKDALPEYYGDTDLILDLYPKDKIELLEFTGHYGMDGNEIYTGYIVSFSASNQNYIGVVEWDKDAASYVEYWTIDVWISNKIVYNFIRVWCILEYMFSYILLYAYLSILFCIPSFRDIPLNNFFNLFLKHQFSFLGFNSSIYPVQSGSVK